MGKVTGFLEIDRQDQQLPAGRRPHPPFPRIRCRCGREVTQTGGALHGLRHSLSAMADRLPGQQPDPRLERPRLPAATGRRRSRNLHSTNNFPEFTGRICPAPCEEACTLNLEDMPVTIKTIEAAIADKAWDEGWIRPEPPGTKTGKRVAIIGSGPAGMAAAQQLARAGHDVHVYEGTPPPAACCATAFPTSRWRSTIIDRRVAPDGGRGRRLSIAASMSASRMPSPSSMREHDAVLLAGGAEKPRDLPFPAAISTACTSPCPTWCSRTAASPASRRRATSGTDPRRRQACRRHRRRRYRLRLRRHLVPPGRALGHPARHPAAAAGEGGQGADLALLADQDAHLVQPGRRRRARVRA